MEYNFREIEKKWQKYWLENRTFKAEIDYSRPKYYVLDMFPYPSGTGLHVGHPLGYIASDIYTRYKRLNGFNVLHPMGYDAFGLPAEQFAIQTGTHPAVTTAKNILRYREQLDKIGFSFDWDREVKTSDPAYYKWTQWTFIRLFKHWYNNKTQKAEPIDDLIRIFLKEGNGTIDAACTSEWQKDIQKKDPSFPEKWNGIFTADQWKSFTEKQQQEILMNYRLAYLSEAMVNWCPDLGTVLANDEVANGFSVRGGHPVERKLMRQWFLRITAYAQRLLDGLETIDFSESLKEMQRNWIGRSDGAEVAFQVKGTTFALDIFTTRPDTIFGATFMVLAPEHELAEIIATVDRLSSVREYIDKVKNRSERERMTEVKKVSGEFSGAYCINPLNGKDIPIWVADYVLAGYGTGAIMAVPAHDSRDYEFAKHFRLPIVEVVSGGNISESSYDAKEGILINSDFINGMNVRQAVETVIRRIEADNLGKRKVNYRLRDAIFSRQRYWGEPFPVYFRDGIACVLDESELPLVLPEVDAFLPTETGDPPLARAKNWVTSEGYPYETSTMPGFAGSSGYYLRYMDPCNDHEYFSREANEYWQNVDLYIGGSEHATGHLIYSRFWNKFLFDTGLACKDEPYRKLINQGMILGKSSIIYRCTPTIIASDGSWDFVPYVFYSKNIAERILNNGFTDEDINILNKVEPKYKIQPDLRLIQYRVDIKYVEDDILNIDEFKNWRRDLSDSKFILEDGKFICFSEVEKMSKSFYNVVNPDDLIENYGADTLRLYEMFLGPLEQSKPWDTKGIEGVFRFIRKFWRLFHDHENEFFVSEEEPSAAELKILHKTIKKAREDIERFSFNTAVSSFMICVNELSDLKCSKRAILEPLCILVSPYAPHLAEELWETLGHTVSISNAVFPVFNEEFVAEDTFRYPVSFNGKMRFQLELPIDLSYTEVEKIVLQSEESQKWLKGNTPKKIIYVPKKIINIVI